MPEEEKDVNANAPSALEDAIASSSEAEETPVAQEEGVGTEPVSPQQTETPPPEEEQRVPYDRFKDVVDEKNYYKQLLDRQMSQPAPVPEAPKEKVPQEIGATPEEREFWQMQRKIAREEAESVASVERDKYQAEMQATRTEQARFRMQEFRRTHTDIRPGSNEEREIAQKMIAYKMTENDAYWSVMGPRGVQSANRNAEKQVKQKMQVKKQANVVNSSIPPSSNVSMGGDDEFRKTMERELAAEGL